MQISLTFALIIVTALLSILAWKKPILLDRWMFTPYKIRKHHQWDRFVLSGFIHKDGNHLLFNMFTFFFFGKNIESFLLYTMGKGLGAIIFVLFYIGAIIVSDLPTYFKHKNHSYYKALGASGGVAATVFASIMLMPLADICLFGLLCLPGFFLGMIFLLYTIIQSRKSNDSINHDAHLFGALFGIFFILILSPHSAIQFWEQIKSFRPF